jgi:hypothetical protein
MDPEKYVPGNVIEIFYRRQSIGIAVVKAAPEFEYRQLRDSFCFMNCGKHAAYQAAVLQKFYDNKLVGETKLQHVVFEWQQRNMEAHREMFKDYWGTLVERQPFINETDNPIS